MTSAIRAQREAEDGFTLIELLVVVIIIGILAAIAIPAFLNQRERAWQSELTSAVRNSALEIEAEATQSGGAYPNAADGQAAVVAFVDANVSDATDGDATGDSPIFAIDYNVTDAGGLQADQTAEGTGFSLCMTHDLINDQGGVPTNSIVYLGGVSGSGVQDFEEETCAGSNFHVQ